jgi:hypothetical protein
MKHLIAFALVAALAACGGADPAAPIAQCNGTPRAAVVYVGSAPFPELAAVPNACVYSTQASTIAELDGVVDQALSVAHQPRVYLIGAYTDLPLRWRAARPGIAEITSLWFAPASASGAGIDGSVATIYINDTFDDAIACSALATQLAAQRSAALCQLWERGGFTADQRQAAVAQLQLGFAR